MDSYRCSLLVVDDDPAMVLSLAALLKDEFDVLTADSADAARVILQRQTVDLVLADQQLPGQSGVELLEWVRNRSPKSVRLLMTGMNRFEDALDAFNFGQVSRYFIKPWSSEELLQALRGAARSFLLERSHEELLQQLRRLNLELEDRVGQRTRELEEANRQLQHKTWMLEKLALTDPLTGLPNRRAMDRLARAELRRRARYPGPLTLGMIDVDHFKEINLRHLITGGDQVLVELAKTFSSALRNVDTIGRIGGEEFLLIAPETNLDGAGIVGERIRTAVENSRATYKDQIVSVTVSLGLAVAEKDVLADYEPLKLLAAEALQEAKETGRNRCVIRAFQQPGAK